MSVNVKINGFTYSGINSVKLPLADGSGYAQFDYADSSAGGGDSGGTETTGFSVTNNLTNVTNSNSASTVEQGGSYSATLTAAEGYVLESVTVTMGGVDITSTVYLDGSINIATVSGDIVITATAKAEPAEVPLTKMSVSSGNTVYIDGGETVLWENKYIAFNYISEAIFEKDTPVTLTITTSGAVGQGLYTAYCNDGGIGKVYYYAENFVGYPNEDKITEAGTHTFEVMAKAGYQLVILANENYAPAVTNITAVRNGG